MGNVIRVIGLDCFANLEQNFRFLHYKVTRFVFIFDYLGTEQSYTGSLQCSFYIDYGFVQRETQTISRKSEESPKEESLIT